MYTSLFLLPALAMLAADPSYRFLPGDFVVEAQIIERRVDGDTADVMVKVLRVYSGPSDIKGATFRLSTNAKLRRAQARYYDCNPPLAESETGIWLVRYKDDKTLG